MQLCTGKRLLYARQLLDRPRSATFSRMYQRIETWLQDLLRCSKSKMRTRCQTWMRIGMIFLTSQPQVHMLSLLTPTWPTLSHRQMLPHQTMPHLSWAHCHSCSLIPLLMMSLNLLPLLLAPLLLGCSKKQNSTSCLLCSSSSMLCATFSSCMSDTNWCQISRTLWCERVPSLPSPLGGVLTLLVISTFSFTTYKGSTPFLLQERASTNRTPHYWIMRESTKLCDNSLPS